MQLYLGLEFGSTRIKSVLIGKDAKTLATGSFTWESQCKDGYWTYDRSEVLRGMQESYAEGKRAYESRFGEKLTHLSGIGISGMMHGYLPTDENGQWLAPFRTWRNTSATAAAEKLTEAFGRHIPPRWSASHLYQAALDGEEHLSRVRHLFTLSSYIHYLLTDRIVVGLCEGSGMFPVRDGAYRADCMETYQKLIGKRIPDVSALFPTLLPAGAEAGRLTQAGARLLDISGELQPGVPFCPPEGDAATGMICTNSIAPGTANVSAGTSAFLMAVLSPENAEIGKDLDNIVTPDGVPVVMVHQNSCTGNINRWEHLFAEVAALTGGTDDNLFEKLFLASRDADKTIGGLADYPFFSPEPTVNVKSGGLSVFGTPDGKLTLGNFMKTLLYSATTVLAYGVRSLYSSGVTLDRIAGHGGFFKTPQVGTKIMSAALKAPIVTSENAGEGGAYGMALLALFIGQTDLPRFLQNVFTDSAVCTVTASPEEQAEYDAYLQRYLSRLPCGGCDGAVAALKRRVFAQNLALRDNGLITLTWGNASGIDRSRGLVAIKPSGVSYDEMTADDMVVVDMDGNIVDGRYRPSSDTPTHLALYRAFPTLGGIVHTHSTYATAFAQAGRSIPCYGTTHADAFYGAVPVTRELTEAEIAGAYEHNTGCVITETVKDADILTVPAVLVRHHGVFTFGATPEKALENAVTVEETAKMAFLTEKLTDAPETAPQYLQDKHYFRKHGDSAYYGQK